MKRQRKILVIGASEGAEALIRESQGDRYSFTRCAGDNHPSTSMSQSGRSYDWIVLKGEVLDGDETDLIRSLRAMGFLTFLDRSGCGVEWSSNGTLQLRCGAQALLRHPHPVAGQPAEFETQELVFEFHAPVKRTG